MTGRASVMKLLTPMRIFASLCVMLTAATQIACARDTRRVTEPTDTLYDAHPTDFPVTVTSGPSPTISWQTGRARGIAVTDMDSNTLTQQTSWTFGAVNDQVGFASPVRYGTLPSGGYCRPFLDDPCPTSRPLISGHRYMFTVLTVDYKFGVKIVRM